VALVTFVLVVSGCSTSKSHDASGGGGATGNGSGSGSAGAQTTTTLPPVDMAVSPVDKATGVALDSPVTVKATGGALSAVYVVAHGAPKGALPMAGTLSADKASWTSAGTFAPATTYDVMATSTGQAKAPTTSRWTFTTLTPTSELHTRINVFEGHTYGVGMPLIVQLTHPIPQALHAAVTKRLTVTTAPAIQGGWRWFSDSEVHWRPAAYWPAHTQAHLKVDFAGLNAGDGVWGVDGRTIDFNIGDSHISTVDAVSHQMTVAVNGAVVKTIAVSTGRDKYPTHSGIHAVNDKEAIKTMDSATVGIPRDSPDGYFETVKWDVRISNSGEFVHAAPWSTGDQGNTNVSHGCVNVSDADGEWFYNFSQLGDIVQVLNTPLQLDPDNGYGDWQIPWASWVN
jgi:lipoprotein-anchoring transpeptidase ErfK/SrfK